MGIRIRDFIYKLIGFTRISKRAIIDSTCLIGSMCDIRDGVIMGKYSYCSPKTTLYNNVKIGNFCSIGYNVSIGPFEHPSRFIVTSPYIYKRHPIDEKLMWPKDVFIAKTIIENDVWIGNNSIIIQGVHIGNGAIIAARAVVTHDIPPYEVGGYQLNE